MASDFPRQSQTPELRLNKYLALCGIGSRRACDGIIRQGRVTVDGQAVLELGVRVEPGRQMVCLDGKPVQAESLVYLLFNKPLNVLCTANDPSGRRAFREFFPSIESRVFTVGRLDRTSEGLLVVTNDGDFAHRLMHPRHGVEKTYDVILDRPLTAEDMQRVCTGVVSEGERLAAKTIRPLAAGPAVLSRIGYQLVLHEGRKRHIRRLFETLGVGVLSLRRVAIGPIQLIGLRSGAWRHMTKEERAMLLRAATPNTGGFHSPGCGSRPQHSP